MVLAVFFGDSSPVNDHTNASEGLKPPIPTYIHINLNDINIYLHHAYIHVISRYIYIYIYIVCSYHVFSIVSSYFQRDTNPL